MFCPVVYACEEESFEGSTLSAFLEKKKGKYSPGPIRKTERNRERRDNNGVKKAREAWVELRENVHSRFLHHDLVTYCVTLNTQYK